MSFHTASPITDPIAEKPMKRSDDTIITTMNIIPIIIIPIPAAKPTNKVKMFSEKASKTVFPNVNISTPTIIPKIVINADIIAEILTPSFL